MNPKARSGDRGMPLDIKAALSKPASALTFCGSFIEAYLSPAFGSRTKSEINLLVFACLIQAKAIDAEAPIYDIARALNVTPTVARNLLLNWQLRTTPQGDLTQGIAAVLKKTRFSNDGKLLTFGVESPLLKEEITARLKRKGVFPDASFAKELVKFPVEAFVEFLDEIVDEATKKEVRARLVKDKQLPDRSFKALVTGVLLKLGEKVAGEAGEEVAAEIAGKIIKPAAEKAVGFLAGLLTGDPKAATKGITKDDFIDV
jgi:hypothetical protein